MEKPVNDNLITLNLLEYHLGKPQTFFAEPCALGEEWAIGIRVLENEPRDFDVTDRQGR